MTGTEVTERLRSQRIFYHWAGKGDEKGGVGINDTIEGLARGVTGYLP